MTYSQPNPQANEDLAALFSRTLTFQPQPVHPPQEPPKPQEKEPESEPIIYSITQHYHHSGHIARQDESPAEPQRPSSEPSQTQQPSAESMLRQYGIDHTALSAAQMDLFKTAEGAQKLRLIELWRICPPVHIPDNAAFTWTRTTVEQEELLAQLRYEQRLAEEEQKNSVMSMDGTPLTPVQTGDGHWVATSYMEPYMMSGYEALARREYEESAKRQYEESMARPKDVYTHFGSAVGGPTYRPATDPVYKDEWTTRQQAMENQYGAFQQMDMEL